MAPKAGESLEVLITRLEVKVDSILERLESTPTPDRCASEDGRITAIENALGDTIKPQIADLYKKAWWNVTTPLLSLISLATSLAVGALLIWLRK